MKGVSSCLHPPPRHQDVSIPVFLSIVSSIRTLSTEISRMHVDTVHCSCHLSNLSFSHGLIPLLHLFLLSTDKCSDSSILLLLQCTPVIDPKSTHRRNFMMHVQRGTQIGLSNMFTTGSIDNSVVYDFSMRIHAAQMIFCGNRAISVLLLREKLKCRSYVVKQ